MKKYIQYTLIKPIACHLLFLLSAFQLLSCQQKDTDVKPTVEIKSKVLQDILGRYTLVLSQKKNAEKFVTIDFNVNNDSIDVYLINSPPDLSITSLHATTFYNGFHLYFTGYYPVEYYYTISRELRPSESRDIKKKLDNNRKLEFSEPLFWIMKFYKNSLVSYNRSDSELKSSLNKLHLPD